MAKLSQAQEPSMEEILASIRRIISEDDAEVLVQPAPPSPSTGQASPNLSTDAIDALFAARPEARPAPAAVSPQPRIEPRPTPQRPAASPPARGAATVRQEATATRQDPPAPRQEAPAVRPAAASPLGVRADEAAPSRPLLSPKTDAAVQAAFGNLATTVTTNGAARTLEDLAKEMLRPMLKEWLDTHLPPLVERLVRDEIERVARSR